LGFEFLIWIGLDLIRLGCWGGIYLQVLQGAWAMGWLRGWAIDFKAKDK
jgi:hypothetical protein